MEKETYTEDVNGNGTKKGEEKEWWAVCANQGKYHGTDGQEHPKNNRGTDGKFRQHGMVVLSSANLASRKSP